MEMSREARGARSKDDSSSSKGTTSAAATAPSRTASNQGFSKCSNGERSNPTGSSNGCPFQYHPSISSGSYLNSSSNGKGGSSSSNGRGKNRSNGNRNGKQCSRDHVFKCFYPPQYNSRPPTNHPCLHQPRARSSGKAPRKMNDWLPWPSSSCPIGWQQNLGGNHGRALNLVRPLLSWHSPS